MPVSRREALRKIAVGGAAAATAPLWVESLVASARQHAAHYQAAAAQAAAWTPKVLTPAQNEAVVVIAELIGVKSGLTEFIETQGRFRNFDRVFPVIILIGITGFVMDQILSWMHGLLFPWAGKSDRFSRGVVRALGTGVRHVTEVIRRPIANPPTP